MTPEEVNIFVRLIGAREFALAADSVGVSMGAMGAEADLAGREMEAASRRGILATQALFTMRRMLYGFTLGLFAAGAAALDFGWKYNNAMQTARVALGPVFHDQRALNNELNYLFNLSKFTPFQFKDITIAFRQMYLGMHQLGISSSTVNQTIKSITDSLSATGRTTPGALNRVAVALQHMAYQGHLTGQAVNQLNRDGIPASAILAKMFHLTGQQIHNIAAQGIPTLEFLQKFNQYARTTPGIMNAAFRQATMTLTGMWTTFKDNLGQIMGGLEQGAFSGVQRRVAAMNIFLSTFANRLRTNHGNFDKTLFQVNPGVERIWALLGADIHMLWLNLWNVIHALMTSKALWATLYVGLQLLHGVLVLISPLTAAFGGYLNILIPLFIAWYTATKIATLYNWYLTASLVGQRVAFRDLTFMQFAARAAIFAYIAAVKLAYYMDRLWMAITEGQIVVEGGRFLSLTRLEKATLAFRRTMIAWSVASVAGIRAVGGMWSILTQGYVRGANGQFRAMTTVEKMLLKMRLAVIGLWISTQAWAAAMWEATAAALANPITWIIIAVLALTVGLVILYFKWKAFHDLVNRTFTWLVDNAPYIAAALTIAFGPLGALIGGLLLIIKFWGEIKRLYNDVFGSPGGQNSLGSFSARGIFTPSQPLVPSFAGSTVHPAQHPSHIENGIRVPNQPTGIGYSDNTSRERPYKIQVTVDKKTLGEVTAEQIAQAKRRG